MEITQSVSVYVWHGLKADKAEFKKTEEYNDIHLPFPSEAPTSSHDTGWASFHSVPTPLPCTHLCGQAKRRDGVRGDGSIKCTRHCHCLLGDRLAQHRVL